MATKHHSVKVSSKPKAKGAKKVRHVTIRPGAKGGYITETSFHPQETGSLMSPMHYPDSEEQPHETFDSAMDHLRQSFGEKAAAPAAGGSDEKVEDKDADGE